MDNLNNNVPATKTKIPMRSFVPLLFIVGLLVLGVGGVIAYKFVSAYQLKKATTTMKNTLDKLEKEKAEFFPEIQENKPALTAEQIAVDPNRDTDNDGLSDIKEKELGTNINNPDSDGDNYNDGDEFSKGYNPLGSGLLTEPSAPAHLSKDDLTEDESIIAVRNMMKYSYLRQMQTRLELYYADKGMTYPVSKEPIHLGTPDYSCLSLQNGFTKLETCYEPVGGFFINGDPTPGQFFTYVSADGSTYTITAIFEGIRNFPAETVVVDPKWKN